MGVSQLDYMIVKIIKIVKTSSFTSPYIHNPLPTPKSQPFIKSCIQQVSKTISLACNYLK